MREKIIYEESYKKPGAQIKKDNLPVLNHLNDGFKCVEAHVLKAGVVDRNGEQLEFNDMRIYMKEEG